MGVYMPSFLWPTVKLHHLGFFLCPPLPLLSPLFTSMSPFQKNRQLCSAIHCFYWQCQILKIISLETFEFESEACSVLNFFMTDSLLTVLWIPNQYIYWVLKLGLLSFLQFLFFTCEYLSLTDSTKLETVKLDLLVVVLLLCSTWKYQFSTGYRSHLSSLRN